MKMMPKLWTCFLLVNAIFFLPACRKDKDFVDVAAPVINVSLPAEGQFFANGDTVRILADVTDESNIRTVNVEIRNASGTPIWSAGSIPAGTENIHVNSFMVNSSSGDGTLFVSATDEFGNYSDKNVHIYMMRNVTTELDHSTAVQVFSEAVHIVDEAFQSGTYGTCAVVIQDAINSLDVDTLVVDFGAVNCMDGYGRYKRGKIRVLYTGGYNDSLGVKQISFINYFVNDVQVTGTQTIINNGRNGVGNTVYAFSSSNETLVMQTGTAVFNSNLIFTRVAGTSTPAFTDDAWMMTGTCSGTDHNGSAYTSVITAPLTRNFNCGKYIVQGIMSVTPQNFITSSFDYGVGGCDNSAAITINSNTFNITLF